MSRIVGILAVVGMFVVGTTLNGWAALDDGSEVKIVSPAAGAVIKGDSVDVQYELTKGNKADHVHCFVDGEYQKKFSGIVKGLTLGKHEIKVVAADEDHELLAAEAAVMIEVE